MQNPALLGRSGITPTVLAWAGGVAGVQATLSEETMMTSLRDRPNTALVVIDIQNDVVANAYHRDEVIANINTLVETAVVDFDANGDKVST